MRRGREEGESSSITSHVWFTDRLVQVDGVSRHSPSNANGPRVHLCHMHEDEEDRERGDAE